MSYKVTVKNHLSKRNIIEEEINELLDNIENDENLDSYCYIKIEGQIEGMLNDFKQIHRKFKCAVVEKGFKENKDFVTDLETVKNFHLIKYKRLQKVRLKVSLKK